MEDRQLSCAARLRLALRGGAPGAACLLAILPIAAGAEGVAAPGVDWNEHHRRAVEGFTGWDGDRDGYLEPAEAMELAPDAFQAADRDRDGKLTLVEWVDARFEAIGPGE